MCIFSNHNDRQLKKLRKIVTKINELEPFYAEKSDAELQAMTPEFKKRLAEGAALSDLLPDAFAVVREAAKRRLGMRHFDVQLLGGIVLHRGGIAEMATGEGKTLVSTLPAYLNALTGKGVHVVTVNDYLAKRDAEWMGKIYTFLGLSVGVVVERMPWAEKKKAYSCDVVYATNHALGFDYLNDNMALVKEQLLQRELNYAIIDEVDSILIDEARNPLIISAAPQKTEKSMYMAAQRFVKTCTSKDYQIEKDKNKIMLTQLGLEKAEKFFQEQANPDARLGRLSPKQSDADAAEEVIANPLDSDTLHHINNALRANYMLKSGVDYYVDKEKQEIILIDQNTGRLKIGQRLSDGLHQAVEAKENIEIRSANQTKASISLQNFFRLYAKISGMTGTAKGEEVEFKKTYSMDVVSIPTNQPVRRIDEEDRVFLKREDKLREIVADIKDCYDRGQPVLVGTVSVEKSEELSALLKKENIPHNVLNAVNYTNEAGIVAQAGRFKQVTIATNMAGRGTDIMLGGNPETLTLLKLEKMFCEIAGESYREETSLLVEKLHSIKADVDKFYKAMTPEERAARIRRYEEVNKAVALEMSKKDTIAEAIHLFVRAGVDPFRPSDPILDEVRKKYDEELKKDEEETAVNKQEVLAAGGLRVIGTERHDSRRIDNQLRGRSGRQGDIGSSVFYVSMEDDLLKNFNQESSGIQLIASTLSMLEGQHSGKFSSKIVRKAQAAVENQNYSIRNNMLAYDNVMNRQREIIYSQRRKVLLSDDVHEEIVKMVPAVVQEYLREIIDFSIDEDYWDYDQINQSIEERFLPFGSNRGWCSDAQEDHVEGYDEIEVTVKYDDCNPFGVVSEKFGKITSLSMHAMEEVSDSVKTAFDSLGESFAAYMANFEIPTDGTEYIPPVKGAALRSYTAFYKQAFETFKGSLFDVTKSANNDLARSAVIGANHPYSMVFGTEGSLEDIDLHTVIAHLFGFDSKKEFMDCAEKLALMYAKYRTDLANDVPVNKALENGCFLAKNKSFIFPIAIRNGVFPEILIYVIVDAEGRVSVWVNDIIAALWSTNFNEDYHIEKVINNELYCKNRLFIKGPDLVTKELAYERNFHKLADTVTNAVLAFYEKKREESKDRVLVWRGLKYHSETEANPFKRRDKARDWTVRIHKLIAINASEIAPGELTGTFAGLEKGVLLEEVDKCWAEQMVEMEELRTGIYLRALGNKDPVTCYALEGFEMFDKMNEMIRRDTVFSMFRKLRMMIRAEDQRETPPEVLHHFEQKKKKNK